MVDSKLEESCKYRERGKMKNESLEKSKMGWNESWKEEEKSRMRKVLEWNLGKDFQLFSVRKRSRKKKERKKKSRKLEFLKKDEKV